jgi:hypothetical protein
MGHPLTPPKAKELDYPHRRYHKPTSRVMKKGYLTFGDLTIRARGFLTDYNRGKHFLPVGKVAFFGTG